MDALRRLRVLADAGRDEQTATDELDDAVVQALVEPEERAKPMCTVASTR